MKEWEENEEIMGWWNLPWRHRQQGEGSGEWRLKACVCQLLTAKRGVRGGICDGKGILGGKRDESLLRK